MNWIASKNPICPECASAKHQNCDGIADIDENDDFIDCACEEGDHILR